MTSPVAPLQVLAEDYTDMMRAKLGLKTYDATLSTEVGFEYRARTCSAFLTPVPAVR